MLKKSFAKQDPKQKAKDLADKTFSWFIRTRAANAMGYAFCVTCSKPTPTHWEELQCGHYFSRSCNSTRHEEDNAHAQCGVCNTSGSVAVKEAYDKYMREKYGVNRVQELRVRSNQTVHYNAYDYCVIAETFLNLTKVNCLQKQIPLPSSFSWAEQQIRDLIVKV